MSFAIPKNLKAMNSLQSEIVIPLELNDTDVDRMLTRIFEMAIKRGRTAGSKTDTRDYVRYLDALQQNDHLVGFTGERGRDILDGWVRSSILKEERAGLRRDTVQMGYLRPLTIASYRSGLPKLGSRNRKADVLIYQSVERLVRARGSSNPSAEIDELFRATFGKGVDVGTAPWHEPRYDEETEVDIDTLLSLRFLEGFEASQNNSRAREPLDPPVPLAVDPMARDVLALLEVYGPLMPVAEAYAHFSAVISLRLLQLPLVSARTVRALLSGQDVATEVNPCEMYVDFVRRSGSASDELSHMSVIRDLEILRTFFRDRLLMRSLSDAVPLMERPPDLGQTAADRLASLAGLQSDPEVQLALRLQLKSIYDELEEGSEGRTFIDDIRGSDQLSSTEKFTHVLVEGLRKRGLENQVKWFHSTGGITKPYGMLAGASVRARSTWRYSPSDEALTTLLCLCFVEADGSRTAPRLGIRAILDRLEHRFGILIDRPPTDLDSADARAGAAENLAAFTQRLKLLGCFQGLSDDFTAQFVTRPREATR